MKPQNYLVQVQLGGFVAGIVYNVGEAILNIVVLGGDKGAMVRMSTMDPRGAPRLVTRGIGLSA